MRADDRTPDAVGFPPVCDRNASVLILGSLPGQKSLEATQYYAQPRNSFWRIMGLLFGASPSLPYQVRLETLKAQGVAVWDVLASGRRPGSLDSSIVTSSIVVNDFATLFDAHRGIELICFNGKKAAELYRRHVLPTLAGEVAEIESTILPSTSPAHAAMSFEDKLARGAGGWAQPLSRAGSRSVGS